MQPRNVRRRVIESREIDLNTEHTPRERDLPRVVVSMTLDIYYERSCSWLACANDHWRSGVTEQSDIFAIWGKHIHQISRQPPQGTDGEVKPVWQRDRNGVTAMWLFVWQAG
jgi:hypothetical protein